MLAPVNRLAVLLAATLCVGCAHGIESGSEAAPGVNLQQYDSFAWISEDISLIGAGRGNPRIRNEENERRIRQAIENSLAARGLQKVSPEEADLVVVFTVGTKEDLRLEGATDRYSFLTSKQATRTYYEGTLSIDLFDAQSRQQIWHGWASKPLNPTDDPDQVVNEAVTEIMQYFPAGS